MGPARATASRVARGERPVAIPLAGSQNPDMRAAIATLVLLGALSGCMNQRDFLPPDSRQMHETLFVLRLPAGDDDPEGTRLPTGILDRQAPLSPAEAVQIRWLLREFATSTDETQQEAFFYLLRFGRRSLPELLATTAHAHPALRIAAVNILLNLGAPEADPALVALLEDPEELVRLEAATALLYRGHHAGIALLIDGLESGEEISRHQAIGVLARYCGDTRGYRWRDPPEVRKPAVERWRAWWAAESPNLPP